MRPDLRVILNVPAQLSIAERLALSTLAANMPEDEVIVEVGPYRGGSTRIMLESAQDRRLFTIDVVDNIDRELLDLSRVTLVLGGAGAFAAAYNDLRVGFLFIDGDHSFSGVRADFQALHGLLSAGGQIAFHDFTPHYCGIQIYCQALAAAGILHDCIQADTLFVARCDKSRPDTLTDEHLAEAMRALIPLAPVARPDTDRPQQYRRLRAGILDGTVDIIGTGSFGTLLARFYGLPASRLLDSSQARPDGEYLVCSYQYEAIKSFLTAERGVEPQRIHPGESFWSLGLFFDLVEGQGDRTRAVLSDPLDLRMVDHWRALPEETIFRAHLSGQLGAFFQHNQT